MSSKFPVELMVWFGALILLAMSNPGEHHYSLCPLDNLGFSWCPGCGLGRSISSLLHFDFRASIQYHWFGMPAFVILLNRMLQLSQKFILH